MPPSRFAKTFAVAGSRYFPQTTPPVQIGDVVRFEAEPTNRHDPDAVLVTVGSERIGYVPTKGKFCPDCLDILSESTSYCPRCGNPDLDCRGLAYLLKTHASLQTLLGFVKNLENPDRHGRPRVILVELVG